MELMYRCNFEKFRQNEGLRNKLLATGDATIVEASPFDSYWGCGKNGLGANNLGKVLMRVRAALQAIEDEK